MSSTIEATPPVVRLATPHDTVPGNRDAHGFGWACTHEMTVTEMVDRAKRCKCYSQDETCGECRSREPGTRCEASGSDRAVFLQHMRGHGQRTYAGARPVKLHRKTPAATLPKLKIDPLKWIEWTDYHREPAICDCGHHQDAHGPDTVTDEEGHWEPMEYTRTGRPKRRKPRYIPAVTHETDPGCTECDCTRPDYEIYGELRNAVRRGQFWAEASTSAVWVLPLAPAPWETARTLARVHVSEIREAPEPAQADFDSLAAEPAPVLAEIVTEDTQATEDAATQDTVQVYDVEHGTPLEVPRAEAVAGMVRYARSLGPGSPACGEVERQALELARGEIDRAALDGTPAPEGDTTMTGYVTDTSRIARDAGTETAGERLARLQEMGQAAGERMAARARGEVAVPAQYPVALRAPIDGDRLLRDTRKFFRYFALWPNDESLNVATLYAAAAHAKDPDEGVPIWEYMAKLLITALEYGAGKSWFAKLIAALCPDGIALLEPTKPSLIDEIAMHKTVVITEVDELLATRGRNRGIVAVINGSYEPGHYHTRKRGDKAEEIHVFGPMILDGVLDPRSAIRKDLRAIMSRSFAIQVHMAPAGYRRPRWDKEAREHAKRGRDRLAAWMAQEVANGMEKDRPDMPADLGSPRRCAMWEALFTVALRADMCAARRDHREGDPEMYWSKTIATSAKVVEDALGLPYEEPEGDEEQDESQMSDLDRALAEMED